MQTNTHLTYFEARRIYLEIANYPVAIAKFQEYGLSEDKAKQLADTVSRDLSDYELASDTFSRELWTGILLTLVGLASIYVVFYFSNDHRVEYFRLLRIAFIAGVWQLKRAWSKWKIIRRFNKQADFPVAGSV